MQKIRHGIEIPMGYSRNHEQQREEQTLGRLSLNLELKLKNSSSKRCFVTFILKNNVENKMIYRGPVQCQRMVLEKSIQENFTQKEICELCLEGVNEILEKGEDLFEYRDEHPILVDVLNDMQNKNYHYTEGMKLHHYMKYRNISREALRAHGCIFGIKDDSVWSFV
jgi:hypothetical protein